MFSPIFSRSTVRQQGFLLVIFATLLFSTKGIFIKLAYHYPVAPAQLMFIRMMIALPFYLFVLLLQHRRNALQVLDARSVISILFFGFCGYYLATYWDLTALQYLPASLERLVLYTYPSIVLLLSVLFLGKRLDVRLVSSLLIIYSGLLLVFARELLDIPEAGNRQQLWGALLVFAAAFSFSVYLLGSEVMMRTIPSRLFTAMAMLSASVAILVHFVLNYEWRQLLQLHGMVYVYGAAVAIVCTVLPSFMLSSGIQRVGAATGSAVGSLGPVVTLVMAVIFLGESVTVVQAAGFVLVILGVMNLGRSEKRGRCREQTPDVQGPV